MLYDFLVKVEVNVQASGSNAYGGKRKWKILGSQLNLCLWFRGLGSKPNIIILDALFLIPCHIS
jgi:hypothetical protein